MQYNINKQMQVRPKIEEEAIEIGDDQMVEERPPPHPALDLPSCGKTQFDLMFTLCKERNIEEEDPNQVLKNRLVKYFFYNQKIEPGREYFAERKQADYSNENDLIGNQLIIFGCDFKKFKLVKLQYETRNYVRINPSNFKLIYPDNQSAWKVLNKMIKDPSTLVRKCQSEDSPLPRCWFEMKSYTFLNRQIKVFVRYATEKERNIEPSREEWLDAYNRSRKIYNDKEEERKERELVYEAKQKEKLEIKKQRMTNRIYQRYGDQNGQQWKRGSNRNPGARKQDVERQKSRSRSRQKERIGNVIQNENILQNIQNDDKVSNYSFIFSKSKKDLKQLQQAMNQFNFDDEPLQNKEKEINLNDSNLSFQFREEGEEEIDWNGKKVAAGNECGWYRKYMLQQQAQQEKERRKKEQKKREIELIIID